VSFPFDLHSTAVERRPCCAVALRRTAWHVHGMANVNQTRPHCVNQMGKTHSKLLAAWHGMAGERHGRGMETACYVWIGLKCVKLFYTHRVPPTSYGHSCGLPQGGRVQMLDKWKYYRLFETIHRYIIQNLKILHRLK